MSHRTRELMLNRQDDILTRQKVVIVEIAGELKRHSGKRKPIVD